MILAALIPTTGLVVAPVHALPTAMRRIQPALMMSDEADAKAAWLSKLDTPAAWRARTETPAVANEVVQVQEHAADDATLKEEAAKKAWLAKLDVPSWGKLSEEDAKKKWLAKLDVPSWGKGAPKIQTLVEDCEQGSDTACVSLSAEEDAKIAWLAKLDSEPSWKQSTRVNAPGSTLSEDDAALTSTMEAAQIASLAEDCVSESDILLAAEEAAKKAWLAKLDVPAWGMKVEGKMSEEEAKKAWLSKLDVPSWQGKVTPMSKNQKVATH